MAILKYSLRFPEPMGFKGVMFDLDGTLVHTRPEYRYRIVGQTLNDLKAKSSREDIDRFWFETDRDRIITESFKLEPEKFWPTYRSYDSAELRSRHTELYDDVDFLGELKQNGYKIGLVTGAPAHILELELGMIGADLFDIVVRAQLSNGIRPKPDPHGLEECLNQLGIQNTEGLYIGNAEEDIKTAQNAKVLDVLLDRGEYKFNGVNPSMRINTLYDLREILSIQ